MPVEIWWFRCDDRAHGKPTVDDLVQCTADTKDADQAAESKCGPSEESEAMELGPLLGHQSEGFLSCFEVCTGLLHLQGGRSGECVTSCPKASLVEAVKLLKIWVLSAIALDDTFDIYLDLACGGCAAKLHAIFGLALNPSGRNSRQLRCFTVTAASMCLSDLDTVHQVTRGSSPSSFQISPSRPARSVFHRAAWFLGFGLGLTEAWGKSKTECYVELRMSLSDRIEAVRLF
jgi:hypothetical protein